MTRSSSVHPARVLRRDARDSHALLEIGRGRLAVRAWPGLVTGKRVRVRIRPEDVVLAADPPGRVSARNVLPGHVRSIKLAPEGAYVTADVGFGLVALVTRAAVADLELRRGSPVFALIKATAVEPAIELEARLAVAVRGPRGDIDARRLGFLREIAATGSLMSAARALGVTYRTAWLWVQEINRAWGRALVTRTRGGRGGGGAALTPQGLELVHRVDRAERSINRGARPATRASRT